MLLLNFVRVDFEHWPAYENFAEQKPSNEFEH